MSDQVFSDLLVIDCASFIAGPAAGTILADYGARVIKIEPPGTGDGYRLFSNMPGMPQSETNYGWSLTNRSKESLALDLKHAEGRAILDKLLQKADVFITNYPLGVRERLKLRAQEICAVNPRLIYASLTPYGETGPEAGNTAYDATAWWARSGLMDSIRATSDSPPAMPVPAMGDHMAANMLYGAILTALYRRERTGRGGAVGSSLMGNGIWSNGLYVQAALDGAETKRHMGRERLGALTQMYQCRDDRWFMLTLLPQAQDKLWPQLARCMGHQEWIEDPAFIDSAARRENNAELTALLSSVFKERDWQDWRVDFEKYGITSGCIAKSVDHGMDEQARVTGMITEFDDGSGARTIDSPLYVDGEQKRSPHPAPRLGEHSLAILAEFGIGAQTITNLCDEGIVGGHAN